MFVGFAPEVVSRILEYREIIAKVDFEVLESLVYSAHVVLLCLFGSGL